ncbi:MAG: substrate-binding domain-containing protein, partial [Planctomycetota bacterium]
MTSAAITGAYAAARRRPSSRRPGCVALALTAVAVFSAAGCKEKANLTVHVGGTMRPVMQELAKLYQENNAGVSIEINTAGSGELLAHIESHKAGDLYVCHDPFLALLMKRGLGTDGWTVAELTPVIVVQKGDRTIKNVRDATEPGIELVLTDFEKSTLGHILETIFKKAGRDDEEIREIRRRAKTFRKGGQAAT